MSVPFPIFVSSFFLALLIYKKVKKNWLQFVLSFLITPIITILIGLAIGFWYEFTGDADTWKDTVLVYAKNCGVGIIYTIVYLIFFKIAGNFKTKQPPTTSWWV
jgi:hypothetical protein